MKCCAKIWKQGDEWLLLIDYAEQNNHPPCNHGSLRAAFDCLGKNLPADSQGISRFNIQIESAE